MFFMHANNLNNECRFHKVILFFVYPSCCLAMIWFSFIQRIFYAFYYYSLKWILISALFTTIVGIWSNQRKKEKMSCRQNCLFIKSWRWDAICIYEWNKNPHGSAEFRMCCSLIWLVIILFHLITFDFFFESMLLQ